MNNMNNMNYMNNTNFMNTNDKSIYRLVKPYQSTKVYEAKTIMHGAGKCYKELKKTNTNCDSFAIMNVNDNSIYDFKLSPLKTQQMVLHKDTNQLINNQYGGNDIEKLKNDIEMLKNRINVLENKQN
jgi:hypothetical protein